MTNSPQINHTQAELDLEHLNALLHRYCLSLTKSIWDSDDLVQDTWVKILEKINERQHDNPEALLLRTAKNRWIDHVRRRQVFDRILDKEQELAKEAHADLGDNSTFDLEIAFYYLIKHLSPLQRTVLLLRSVLGYSVAETADKLFTTEGAVKAAYHRARKTLETKEQELGEVHIDSREEELRTRLNALANAYMDGEVDEVLRLVQENEEEQEMVMAVGSFTAQSPQGFASSGYSSQLGSITMAA